MISVSDSALPVYACQPSIDHFLKRLKQVTGARDRVIKRLVMELGERSVLERLRTIDTFSLQQLGFTEQQGFAADIDWLWGNGLHGRTQSPIGFGATFTGGYYADQIADAGDKVGGYSTARSFGGDTGFLHQHSGKHQRDLGLRAFTHRLVGRYPQD